MRPHLTPEGKFALLLIVCEFLIFIPFALLDQPSLGVGVCVSASVILTAIKFTWKEKRNVWFWLAALLSVGLQLPFIRYFPWSTMRSEEQPFFLSLCSTTALSGDASSCAKSEVHLQVECDSASYSVVFITHPTHS